MAAVVPTAPSVNVVISADAGAGLVVDWQPAVARCVDARGKIVPFELDARAVVGWEVQIAWCAHDDSRQPASSARRRPRLGALRSLTNTLHAAKGTKGRGEHETSLSGSCSEQPNWSEALTFECANTNAEDRSLGGNADGMPRGTTCACTASPT